MDISSFTVAGPEGVVVLVSGSDVTGDADVLAHRAAMIRRGDSVALTPTGPFLQATGDPNDRAFPSTIAQAVHEATGTWGRIVGLDPGPTPDDEPVNPDVVY